MIFKIVFSEINSPTDSSQATNLGKCGAVRAVNCSKQASEVFIVSPEGDSRSITLTMNESIVLKKYHLDKVYSSNNNVRIAGVSIF